MAPIIRTCNAFFLCLGAVAGSAAASRPVEPTALSAYVSARLAEAEGDKAGALGAYASAFKAEPDSPVIALGAFRQAVERGDKALALRAAEALHQGGELPDDAALLLIGIRLQKGDVAGATRLTEELDDDKDLTRLLPALKGWIGVAARDPSAPDLINGADTGDTALSGLMATEQRALIGLLAGRKAEALALIRSAPPGESGTGALRMTAAATLSRMGDSTTALTLLNGRDLSYAIARQRLEKKLSFDGAITNPVEGLAYFYARLAGDLVRDRAPYYAMTLGRYARFLDPASPYIAMAEAQALAANQWEEEALAALNRVSPHDPYAPIVQESRIALYHRLGENEKALEIAAAAAQNLGRAADYVRLGESLARLGRHQEAAKAFDAALDASDKTSAPDEWTILIRRGLALLENGDWPAAEADYRRALARAPNQPSLLNLLGYSLLERREKIDEAMRLVTRAHELQPYDAAITDSLGWAYFLSGNLPRALELLEDAVRAEPSDPTINEHLGDAYWQAGRRVEARYSWRAALLTADEKAIPRLSEKVDFGMTAQTAAR